MELTRLTDLHLREKWPIPCMRRACRVYSSKQISGEYNYHDSLQAYRMEGIGNSEKRRDLE